MLNFEQEYQETLDFLYSFVDYSLTRQLRFSPEKFNLDRMRVFAEKLGNPHRRYPVVHIAGTKGKGSTAAFISSVLEKAGYKVGLYTSPHLHDYIERIQINRRLISHQELTKEVNTIKGFLSLIPEITTFEITTAIAFKYFAEKKVDIAVIEVGLGGRLDATNIVDPEISVITSLSYDHMNVLGDTIEKIAGEKGGIIKPNKPVIIAPQRFPQSYSVLKDIASRNKSPHTQVDKKIRFASLGHTLDTQQFSIREVDGNKKTLEFSIPLLGYHQVENAATAWCALKELTSSNYVISDDDIKIGFATAEWSCRFEIINSEKLVIIDSAHNADSAEKLAATATEYFGDRKITLIFGASEDKDIRGMLDSLLPISDDIIVTKSVHPRAMSPEKLKTIVDDFGRNCQVTENLEEALKLAFSSKIDNVIIVTGSIFVAAAAKEIIQKRNQEIE